MYTLNVLFTQADLKVIQNANENVVLIKQVPDGGNKLTWVTFEPFEKNIVTWNNDYYLFASNTDPVEGHPIIVNSKTKAQAHYTYTFTNNSFSNGDYDSQLGIDQYGVKNEQDSSMQFFTFGMAQNCTVNGTEKAIMPINAEVVPHAQFAQFTPEETVLIFLASDLQESEVYNNVRVDSSFLKTCANSAGPPSQILAAQSISTELSFSKTNEITVEYSNDLGKFVETNDS